MSKLAEEIRALKFEYYTEMHTRTIIVKMVEERDKQLAEKVRWIYQNHWLGHKDLGSICDQCATLTTVLVELEGEQKK